MIELYNNYFKEYSIKDFENVNWIDSAETRRECFMSESDYSYTYGRGRGIRTYKSIPFHPIVLDIILKINNDFDLSLNKCFLNCYRDERQHLGWHSDNFRKMDDDSPIAVVSFGGTRELWVRNIGYKGLVPKGFQKTHKHKIPKSGHVVGPRISLTYRKFTE